MWDRDHWACALVGRVSRGDLVCGGHVGDVVLASGGPIKARAGQRRRNAHKPAERVRDDRYVLIRVPGAWAEETSGRIENHERLLVATLIACSSVGVMVASRARASQISW